METADHFRDERVDALFWNVTSNNIEQDRLIYRCEEFPNITLEYPNRVLVIFTCLICKGAKLAHRFVRTLVSSARVRIISECGVE